MLFRSVPPAALIEMGFSEEDANAGHEIFGPKGCEKCGDSGFKGRVGVYEVVKITPEISRIIMEDGNSIQIADVCQEQGFSNIPQSGLVKVKNGLTSMEEIERVSGGGH